MSREVSAISIAIVSAKLPQHEIVLCPLAHELLFTIFAFLMFLHKTCALKCAFNTPISRFSIS